MKRVAGLAMLVAACGLGCRIGQQESSTEPEHCRDDGAVPTCSVPSEAVRTVRDGCEGNLTAVRSESGFIRVFSGPGESVVSDQFQYSIEIDQARRVYWIYKSGGVAGAYEKPGPLKMESNAEVRN